MNDENEPKTLIKPPPKDGPRRGPKVKFYQEQADRFLAALRITGRRQDACFASGIAYRTLAEWRSSYRRGKMSSAAAAAFCEEIDRIESILPPDGPKRGPATVFTQAQSERFLAALMKGASYLECCRISGVPHDAFCTWRKAARNGELRSQAVAEFLRRVETTEAESTVALIAMIREAGANDWRAAAWAIERRDRRATLMASQAKIQAEAKLAPVLMQARIDALKGIGAGMSGATDDELDQIAAILEGAKRRGSAG